MVGLVLCGGGGGGGVDWGEMHAHDSLKNVGSSDTLTLRFR